MVGKIGGSGRCSLNKHETHNASIPGVMPLSGMEGRGTRGCIICCGWHTEFDCMFLFLHIFIMHMEDGATMEVPLAQRNVHHIPIGDDGGHELERMEDNDGGR